MQQMNDTQQSAISSRAWRTMLFAVLFAVCVLSSTVHAQSPTVRFETQTQTFRVGDRVRLDLVVDHAAGQRVLPPSLEMDWGEIELQGVTQPEITLLENGMERTSIVVQVTAWEPGEYITPSFDVRLASLDGSISTLNVQPFPLRVDSVLSPDDLSARDIKPQAVLPLSRAFSPLILGAAGLGAAVLAAGLYIVLQGRRRSLAQPLPESVDDRPPHVVALAELDEIEKAELVGAGQYQQHYTRVSETTRRYLEREFQLTAMEETTHELQRSLQANTSLDEALQTEVIGLLQEADIVKFAKIRPNSTDAQLLPDRARRFIKASHVQKIVDPSLETEEPA